MSSCVQRTSRQVAHSEAVLDPVAGLSVAPTLQAGVFLLRRLQHVVAAQTLKRENAEEYFMSNESWGGVGLLQISRNPNRIQEVLREDEVAAEKVFDVVKLTL